METHLAKCPACEGEMDVTEVGPFTRVHCPECSEEVRVKIEMGPYTLRRRLAVGGMSVLFVAHDNTLGREVAVKVLNEDYSGDETRVAQFEREAKLTAAVSHPNVVRVYTVGRAFGRYFIAMELVSGKSLEVIMDERGALPEAEVMPIALQVVDGLRAAHTAGLIHRDIKPGNILIDDFGTAKIVDFGLSLLTEGGAVQAEEVWATPYYVPPEALLNLEEDFRSDIYALGASMYHALSGKPPVQSREMSTRVLQEEKKNVAPLGRVATWLHPETVAVVERAMQHSANKRFKSYEDFRTQLELACQEVEGDADKTPIHGSARAERRRRAGERKRFLVVAVVAFLAVIGGVIHVVTRNGPAPGEEEAAPEEPSSPFVGPAPTTPDLLPTDRHRISESYRLAREALASHDYVAAEGHFDKVASDEAAPAATAVWARFEAVVAAYLNGRPGDARAHLADLGADLEARGTTETALGRRLRAASQVLDSLEYVSDERIPRELAEPVRATVFFAMALKMWEQGQLDRARDHLTKLVEAGPWEDTEWMTIYQDLARTYLEEHARLEAVDRRVDLKDAAAIQAKHHELAELYVLLQTRGRARFNVRAWQADLKRALRALEDAEGNPGWIEVRNRSLDQWRRGKVRGARATLAEFVPISEEAALRKAAILALLEAAEGVPELLGKLQRPVELEEKLRLREGGECGGIVRGEQDGLVVRTGDGEQLRPWRDFEPDSLLAAHLQVLHEVEDGEARKQGLSAGTAFALLGGLSAQRDLLFSRVRNEPAPGGFGTWADLRALLEGEPGS